jgi:hypothetical protein
MAFTLVKLYKKLQMKAIIFYLNVSRMNTETSHKFNKHILSAVMSNHIFKYLQYIGLFYSFK